MPGLDFLYSPNSQAYEAGQRIRSDDLRNTGLDLQNQQMQAQMPGIQGVSMSQMAKGQVDSAGVDDNIEANHADYLSKMDDNQLKMVQNFGEKAGQLGAILEQVPAPLRMQQLPDLAQKFGIDINHPAISGLVKQAGPEHMGKALTMVGEKIAGSTSKAINARELANIRETGDTKRQEVAGKFAVEAAGKKADSTLELQGQKDAAAYERALLSAETRLKAAETTAQRAQAKLDLQNRLVQLLSVPEAQRDDGWNKQYEETYKTAAGLKAAGTNQVGATMMEGGNSYTPQARADDVVKSVTNKAPGTHTLSELKKVYPGKTDQQLREAYKKKTGKDLN